MRAARLSLFLPLLVACGSPPPSAVAPAQRASANASAIPTLSVPPPAPTPPPPPLPPTPASSEWHEILQTALPELELAAFDGGAVIAARSFIALVTGDEVRQEPRFLAGVPEWINWDASTYLEIPSSNVKAVGGLPRGLVLSAHAGNRHGPDFDASWGANGWSTRPLPADPRRAKLPKKGQWVDEVSLSFGTGDLLVVRFDASVQAFHVGPDAPKPVQSDVPLGQTGYRHVLVGRAPDDAYLCEASTGLLHYDGKGWSDVDTDDFVPGSCAVTSDGTLWVASDDRPGQPSRLMRRKADAWTEVPLPDGRPPTRIVAAGMRTFVAAATTKPQRAYVYSNEPVAQAVSVDENALAGPLWLNGITGLDVTSVDVASVSADPAGPGTQACTSLVVWLGPKLDAELEKALGPSPPRLVEVAGVKPGQVTLVSSSGAQMRVQPSGQKRLGVAALPKSYAEGMALVAAVNAVLPEHGARLLCATPRIVRDLKVP